MGVRCCEKPGFQVSWDGSHPCLLTKQAPWCKRVRVVLHLENGDNEDAASSTAVKKPASCG